MRPSRTNVLRYLARLGPNERPSVAEIARAVGLRSTQTVHYHLKELEGGEYIERGEAPPHQRRPVALTQKGWEAIGRTPMLGRVAAGGGIEAILIEEASYSLAAELFAPGSGRRRYALRATGDSMTGARIEEGDVLLVEENEDPPDGTVVVALLDGETVTVKRLHREGETVRLKPQNGEHEDIVVPAEEVRVQGEVVMVLHPPSR